VDKIAQKNKNVYNFDFCGFQVF